MCKLKKWQREIHTSGKPKVTDWNRWSLKAVIKQKIKIYQLRKWKMENDIQGANLQFSILGVKDCDGP